jgi:predicted nucleic acid-binding Zn ribbon protein
MSAAPADAEEFECPVCGADVPPDADTCPDCGADERTGWSDQTIYDGTNIEDPGDFDHEDWERRERGRRPTGMPGEWVWRMRGIALIVLFVWLAVWLFRC